MLLLLSGCISDSPVEFRSTHSTYVQVLDLCSGASSAAPARSWRASGWWIHGLLPIPLALLVLDAFVLAVDPTLLDVRWREGWVYTSCANSVGECVKLAVDFVGHFHVGFPVPAACQ
ncbi:hypothetical protein ABZP36_002528 [Zizania latifolia]